MGGGIVSPWTWVNLTQVNTKIEIVRDGAKDWRSMLPEATDGQAR